jgi:signal transduction histidine kinase
LLIVDDDEVDRRLYLRLLSRHAPGTYEIEQATDGAEGLAALRERSFDCVLLDFNLPDMSGLTFIAHAKSGNRLLCAFVLVTGQGNEVTAVEAMKLGAQDYLVKASVGDGRLWQTIEQAINQKELQVRLEVTMRDLSAANAALKLEIAVRAAAEADLRNAKEAAERANAALTQEIAIRELTELELRVAKEAAEEASRAKSRFLTLITHEFRTPLNGVLGYAQLLRLEGSLSQQQSTRIDAMARAGRQLLEMIERVLDFAGLETGRIELRPAPVSVHDLTEECVDLVDVIATERGLRLTIINSLDAPRKIVADPIRVRQILINLLGNAIKFTNTGSVELRIRAGFTKGSLRLEVVDTGPGIDHHDRERLFQEFERLDAGISVEGAGLGLAISARIARQMGAAIGHEPNPSGGSVFWLELPPGDVDAPSAPALAPVAFSRARH